MAYQGVLSVRWRTLVGMLALAGMLLALPLSAHPLEFNLYQRCGQAPGKTVLIVGGIQGDEPGGFNAAALLLTHYAFTRGNVWVVPNLNFPSIIKRSRGVYGDLNRKFDQIPPADPEYRTIQRIKKIITSGEVDLVLNLHDGSGFHREHHIDDLRNPDRWGQSVIIDRESMGPGALEDLTGNAVAVVAQANRRLMDSEHVFSVMNTQTHLGNIEMAKTLTYFAVQNGKPAYGLEVSKSFPTHLRAYYHLSLVEAFLDMAGIGYQRQMPLAPEPVLEAIDNNVRLSFHDHRVVLTADNARRNLRYFPLRKDSALDFIASNPLLTVIATDDTISVHHGNRDLVRISPSYYDYDDDLHQIDMLVDGRLVRVGFGEIVDVKTSFTVVPIDGYRTNVIGFTRHGADDEAGMAIRQSDIMNRYSMDRSGWVFRVEVYRDPKFAGMVLVNFNPQQHLPSNGFGFPGTTAMSRPTDAAGKQLAAANRIPIRLVLR
ncbi:MAG: M99 family carboxypeptidase catalytic domain-containing protein [Pseudomonadota bacterium]